MPSASGSGRRARNLDTIVERFQDAGARVLVCGMRVPPNYGERVRPAFERLFAEVAAKRKAALMPFFPDGVAADARLNQADGFHPDRDGYRIIADRLGPTCARCCGSKCIMSVLRKYRRLLRGAFAHTM